MNRKSFRKSSKRWARSGPVLAAVLLLSASCGKSKKPIVVGSKSTTAQVVLAEIVAQHLEHRLERKIQRSFSIGNTPLAYQSLMSGEIGLYPEETGTAQAEILKESPSSDAASTFERVRSEMRRIAQIVVLDPLGVDNAWAVIIKNEKIETLSDAAQSKTGWKPGITRDFSERADGLAAFNQYHLPMGAPPRVSDAGSLYAALDAGEVTMVVGNSTDGPLARHDDWKELRDDKKVFRYYQTCLMARKDLIDDDPKLQPALAELSGRFTNDVLRKLDAKVDVDHKKPAEVAAEFLTQSGLK
jgi:glycine betaine/choline ABC-type transport system substrate-binding protein